VRNVAQDSHTELVFLLFNRCVRVFWPEDALLYFERLTIKLLRLGVVGFLHQIVTQADHTRRTSGSGVAALLPPQIGPERSGEGERGVARKLGIRLWIILRDQIEYHEFCRRGQKQQKSSEACAGMPETPYGAKSHRPVGYPPPLRKREFEYFIMVDGDRRDVWWATLN
jgi:hypothetical protein